MVVNTILIKRKQYKWYQNRYHLMYILDDTLIIDPTYRAIIYYISTFKELLNNINEYYVFVENININIEQDKQNNCMKLHFYNCISTGKILLNVSGIYFTCKQFINKLKRL